MKTVSVCVICRCACKANDAVWRMDSGTFEEKYILPVIMVGIGDTGDANERMNFTLGPLSCRQCVAGISYIFNHLHT